MLSIRQIEKAMRMVADPTEYLCCEAEDKRLAKTLELYEERGEFDGTLQSAQRCLHRASYEVEGYPFTKRLTKKACNALKSRQEMRMLFIQHGCTDFRDIGHHDMPEGTKAYFAMLAIDHHGDATRDNSFNELVSMGRALDREVEEEVP